MRKLQAVFRFFLLSFFFPIALFFQELDRLAHTRSHSLSFSLCLSLSFSASFDFCRCCPTLRFSTKGQKSVHRRSVIRLLKERERERERESNPRKVELVLIDMRKTERNDKNRNRRSRDNQPLILPFSFVFFSSLLFSSPVLPARSVKV